MSSKERLFVFDLDDTLGRKTPLYPAITKSNASFCKDLADKGDLLAIATSRPETLIYQGMAKSGGLLKEEVDSIFPIKVCENGLYVKSKGEVVYNAVGEAPEVFRRIRESNAFFDNTAKEFFRKRGYVLVDGKIVNQVDGGFRLLDYECRDVGELKVGEGLTPLYNQGNDVMIVYRPPRGFLGNDLKRQEEVFEAIGALTKEHLDKRFPGWEEQAHLKVWEDAVDFMPRMKEGIFIKGVGLERALEEFSLPKDIAVYVCGDGSNDIQMVEWASRRFGNYRVVCPSNVSSELRGFLIEGEYRHSILEEDCEGFCEGLERVID